MTTSLGDSAAQGGYSTIGLLFVACMAAGCVHRIKHDPLPSFPIPEAFDAESPQPSGLPDRWWQTFGDPQLNALVERALTDNFQIKSAWSRLKQAQAVARISGAGLWPSLNGQGSVQRQKQVFSALNRTINTTDYRLSVGASYELDIWGKLRSQKEAAKFDALASRDDLEAAAMTLAAQVSETWYGLTSQRARHELLTQQLKTNETFLQLINLRFEQGQATALDVYQQRQQVALTQAQLATTQADIEVMQHQLALLVGRAPQDAPVHTQAVLPPLPSLPAAGVPAQLLDRRPDLRAARRRVEATDARVGVALADLFPALRLTASLGYGATSLRDLFKELAWSVAGSITQPLFEGGRRRAEVERARGALEERFNTYAQTVLQALTEVENALVLERQQDMHIAALVEQATNARSALREARARYVQGLVDFLRVLTALQALQQVEQELLNATRQRIAFRIQLCRALGGTWTADLRLAQEPDKHQDNNHVTHKAQGS
ncbi:MAG: efflux transporter outer membrane subunit [Myxococcota bacterium]